VQLIITTVFCVIAYNVKEFLQFQLDNPAIMWVSFGLLLFVEILIICTRLGKSFPWNMLLLLVFTFCESYTVSFVCSLVAEQNGGEIVLIAAAMTLGKYKYKF
jgi:FtsH-binding integral membrane protein